MQELVISDFGGALGSVSLHDCRANRAEFDGEDLVFSFPDGFCLCTEGEAKRTGPATMRCHLTEKPVCALTATVYRRTLFRNSVRKDLSDGFLAGLCRGDYTFEFVSAYRGCYSLFFSGCLRFDRAPYAEDCDLELHTDRVTLSWIDA